MALRGATIWSDGIGFQRADVLIRDGKIEAVGAALEVPADARVIDVTGAWVLPGFVEAHTQTGLHGDGVRWDTDEDARPITAEMHALDAYYPFAADVEAARRAGITTMLVAPAGKNLVGGTAVLVKSAGSLPSQYVIRQPAALKLSLGEEPKREAAAPRTRMGEMALLRQHFSRAREYSEEGAAGERQEPDAELEATAALLRGEIPAVVQAYTAQDIGNALRLSEEFGFDLVLAYAAEGHLLAAELAARRVPVIVTSIKGLWYRLEKETFREDNAARLLAARVPLALQLGEGNPYGNGDILFNAAYLLKSGFDDEDALRAITSWPAEILGIDDRVGRLAAGLDADIVVLSGPPLEPRSRVLQVLIEGRSIYVAAEGS